MLMDWGLALQHINFGRTLFNPQMDIRQSANKDSV